MSVISGLLLAFLFFPSVSVAGYAIVGSLATPSAGLRLCLAALAGLGIWLWFVAVVNVFLPISFGVAWSVIGISWLITFLLPHARRALVADLSAVGTATGRTWVLAAPSLLMAGLLLPILWHRGLVFYDGTSNHDSFFWITGAEWLQRHTYLTSPDPVRDPAYYAITRAFTGTSPVWARMATEGLLALLASAFRVLPINAYAYVQVGLLPLWIASVVIFSRSILIRQIPVWVFCAGAVFQPIFVFFATNNNLPNLWATLFAPVMLVAFVRLTETDAMTRAERVGWGALAAVMLHGILCSYPEMASFALFASGVAVTAKLFRNDRSVGRLRLAAGVLLAGLAGLLIQPLTTWRLYSGLINSFYQARADSNWGNLFAPLSPGAYLPALTTLNIPACGSLGPFVPWGITVLLLLLLIRVLRRANDRATAVAGLTIATLIIGYTLATGFSYGWQKTAQFSGVIFASIFTMGSYSALAPVGGWRRSLGRLVALSTLAGLMAYATIWGCARSFYWSENKAIDESFLAMRDLSRHVLRDQGVEVVGATFGRSFFYSMWAEYALPYSRLTFDPRGEQMGGYLANYLPHPDVPLAGTPPPAAYLISRAWADTFDAESARISTGTFHALVDRTNKVIAQTDVFPADGVPRRAKANFALTLLPCADGFFEMNVVPTIVNIQSPGTLVVSCGDADRSDDWQSVRLEYPWHVRVPVHGGVKWEIRVESSMSGAEAYPLQLSGLRLVPR